MIKTSNLKQLNKSRFCFYNTLFKELSLTYGVWVLDTDQLFICVFLHATYLIRQHYIEKYLLFSIIQKIIFQIGKDAR